MPTLKLSDEQVVELVEQLPRERQAALLRSLIARHSPAWTELSRVGEERARELARRRGLDWDAMTEDQRESFADDLVHEDRGTEVRR